MKKCSYIYRNSKGDKVKRPNDLDLEIFVQSLAKKSDQEIAEIVRTRCSPDSEFVLQIEESRAKTTVFRNANHEEIKIFRSHAPEIFTTTFSSKTKSLDISFYDPEIPLLPNLTWTTSIDSRRIKVLNDGNFSLNHTYVDHFKSLYPSFADDHLLINPYSQKLFLHLSLLASKDLISSAEIDNAVGGSGIDVTKMMIKEFGLNRFQASNTAQQIKSVCSNWIESHNLCDGKEQIFLQTLRQITFIPAIKMGRELNSEESKFLSAFDQAAAQIIIESKPKESPRISGQATNLKQKSVAKDLVFYELGKFF